MTPRTKTRSRVLLSLKIIEGINTGKKTESGGGRGEREGKQNHGKQVYQKKGYLGI